MKPANGWIFSRNLDLALFPGVAAFAFLLRYFLSAWIGPGDDPWISILLLSIFTDVAHTHSTAFRTHLDPEEWRLRKAALIATPVFAYLILFSVAALTSFTTMTYVLMYQAVWHFVRQQVGWVARSARNAGERFDLDLRFDRLIIYNVTIFPLLLWHTGAFPLEWWVGMEFRGLVPTSWIPSMYLIHWLINLAYVARQIHLVSKSRTINVAKYLIVLTTWVTWYLPVVYGGTAFAGATITLAHAVPYFALTYSHSRTALKPEAKPWIALFRKGAFPAFYAVVLTIAFVHWNFANSLIDHWHSKAFVLPNIKMTELQAIVIGPLLGVFAFSHYIFDAFVWRQAAVPAARSQ